ncbi:MAG: MauE/DoxX family redox-associated membrane protein [Nitrososphaera sp.]
MHPEIRQDRSGNCPKCGMRLVEENSESKVAPQKDETRSLGTSTWRDYMPLAIIVGLILLTSLVLSFRDFQTGNFSATMALSYFMIGFFIVFAGFKLIDLKGFAEGYSTYDLLARKVFAYGYVYPFIELSFGLAMILYPTSLPLLLAEVGVMGFSGLGVSIKLMKREKFQCVCLGTFLKVPLTKVTVLEDFGMVALALVMLFIAA